MSFTEFLLPDPQLTREQVMAVLIQVADELDLPDKRGGAVIGGMIISQEVGVENDDPPFDRRFWCPANDADDESLQYDHDSLADDNRSCGYFQQQKGPNGELWWGTTASEMDLHSAATTFLQRLNSAGYDASNATAAASSGCAIQNPADHAGYIASASGFWDDINALYDQVSTNTAPPEGNQPMPTPTDPRLAALAATRPDFNEFANWCPNNEDRQGTTVDCLLVHTQEGAEDDDNAALDLSNFCIASADTNNPVSYHYAARQASDGGVTVVDMVDTDVACWAVGNSNLRSINYCFAGSDASWTRAEWLTQSKAIDVVAYLVVQDAIKVGIDPSAHITFGPNYDGKPPPVVSDHRYCTDVLQDGNTHVDVGDNFPADVYKASILKYWAIATAAAPPPADPPVTPPAAPTPDDLFQASDADKQNDILAQTRGRWGKLGKNPDGSDRTLVEAIGLLVDKAEGTDNSANTDFSW